MLRKALGAVFPFLVLPACRVSLFVGVPGNVAVPAAGCLPGYALGAGRIVRIAYCVVC